MSSIDDIHQPSGITLATYRDSYEPSKSDFTINTITLKEEEEEFQINEELLRKDFNSEENKIKKEWFFKTFDQGERSAVRTQWYDQRKELKRNINFFEWYETYYVKTLSFMLDNLPPKDHLMVIKKMTNTWKLTNKK